MSKMYVATKTYNHSIGLSTCFRQWRAKSHCKFLHGYSLEVGLQFIAKDLDSNNWVIDFGGLSQIKQWLINQFDHKTLIAKDDPLLDTFKDLDTMKIIQLEIVDKCGCEAFAELIYDGVNEWLCDKNYCSRVDLLEVEVREHAGNSAKVVDSKYVGGFNV